MLSLAFPVLYIKFTHKNSVGAGEEGMVVVGMGTYLLGGTLTIIHTDFIMSITNLEFKYLIRFPPSAPSSHFPFIGSER